MTRSYVCLDTQMFHHGTYSIVPIRHEDRFDIMHWRNQQIFHLRQTAQLTEEQQDRYFDTVIKGIFTDPRPSQLLFSYLHNGLCVGYGGLVHINWIDRHAEVSFIMDTELEKDFFEVHWLNFLGMIEQVAFQSLGFHKIFTYAFDLRPHLYPVLEKKGLHKEAILKEHSLFEGKFVDVLIHAKFNRRENA
jgi:RimJ/RimL family protein N-acetyltransferase